MIKRIVNCLGILLVSVMLLTCCAACSADRETNNDDANVPVKINYEGKYTASDESVLSITKTSEGYEITVSIIRLTSIDDGIGKLNEGKDIISFTASDASGNPIGGEIRWTDADNVVLKFTDSTWEYLPSGTEFSFKRS